MKVQINPLTAVISFVVFVLALYPAFDNYKYNDHSRNWLNHDYGKNLLSSTEEYSVFMTEGGDNQVFSSLYFTYAEKLRQDLFPYDQKGNIFKRIYGDMRYITSDVLEERFQIVNQGLFTGQEPFYAEPRSSRKPYLVPYALGRPATYLTWQLGGQYKLGDFYYKNYGLMYKVQEIRYAVVDYIETIKSAPSSEVLYYLEEKLNRPISTDEFNYWISMLVQDGYVARVGNTILLLKTYPKPFKKDPTETFIRRWNDIPNLVYFDYLSREIVISFSYEQISLLGSKIEELQKLLLVEDSEETKVEINQQIQDHWVQLQEYISTAKEVGYDSSATLHNLGIFYLTAQEKFDFVKDDLMDDAIEVWEMSIGSSPYAWSTYNVLLWGYLRQAFVYPSISEDYLIRFDEVSDKMLRNIKHWKSMRRDIANSQPYQQSSQLFNIRERYEHLSGDKLIEEAKSLSSMARGEKPLQLTEVQSYMSKMANQLTFISDTHRAVEFFELWLTLWKRYQSDPKFFMWHIGLMNELSAYDSYMDRQILLETLKDAPKLVPSVEQTLESELSIFIDLVRISLATKDPRIINTYKTMLLQRAERLLPKEQYESIKQQLEQLR